MADLRFDVAAGTRNAALAPPGPAFEKAGSHPSLVLEVILSFVLMALAGPALLAADTPAGVPALPGGARTHWVVEQPEEIVVYLAFDPATVQKRLPSTLRFITVGELAAGGVPWATEHVSTHPTQASWGISFLEIVRMGTFTIDGRGPHWPEGGAAALWFARVAPSDPATDLGPGRPLLVLDFWVPDRSYVAYMLEKGHYGEYGDVRLRRGPAGEWSGSVSADGLRVVATCVPAGPVAGGAGSAGMQALFPPGSSSVADVVRVAFAGHREQACEGAASWELHGTHPLAGGVLLGSSSFQFGYHLIGGAYPQ